MNFPNRQLTSPIFFFFQSINKNNNNNNNNNNNKTTTTIEPKINKQTPYLISKHYRLVVGSNMAARL